MTSTAGTVNLPVGSIGDSIGVADGARNCSTNNITISPNGTEKIMGLAEDFILDVNGGSVIFVYINATDGWIIVGGSW